MKPPTATGPFKLFPEPQRWFTFADYALVLECMQSLEAERVLEFGPGSSTLALIEGGAKHIDTLEDVDDWARVWEERIVKRFPTPEFPATVHLHRYVIDKGKVKADAPTLAKLNAARYDLAFIDGPRETPLRAAAILFALERAECVFITDQANNEVRTKTEQLVKRFKDREVEFRDVDLEMRRIAFVHPKG